MTDLGPAGQKDAWVRILCFTILLLLDYCVGHNTAPTRRTEYGWVRGYIHTVTDRDGFELGHVERFLGIPYAAPPVGKLRFQYPEPPTPWSEPVDTFQVSPACMQSGLDTQYILDHNPDWNLQMNENCLYINVYVPKTKNGDTDLLPVLVHVHGGSNEVGMGAMFHGDVLALEGNMVVVTFNYRLSAFGFFRAPSAGLMGNWALYDQKLALQWVQSNIGQFRGDSRQVTVQGHSAAGVDVGHHVLSPESKGLFRSVILQSGSPTAYWGLLPDNWVSNNLTFTGPPQYLAALGCISNDSAQVKQCLQSLNSTFIATTRFKHGGGLYNFAPCIDGRFIRSDPSERFQELMRTKEKPNGDTFMVGVVGDEGSMTAEVIVKDAISRKKHGRPMSPQQLMINKDRVNPPDELDDMVFKSFASPHTSLYTRVANIKELSLFVYKPWNDPNNATAKIIELSNLAGDVTFVAPAVHVADKLSGFDQSKVFMYHFTHLSEERPFPTWMGVPHGEDLFYLFGGPITGHPHRNFTEVDAAVSREMIDIWKQFVYFGRPSAKNGSKPFLPYGGDQRYFSIYSNSSGAITEEKIRLRAWYTAYWNVLIPTLANASNATTYVINNNNNNKNDGGDNNDDHNDESKKVIILACLLVIFVISTFVLFMMIFHYRNLIQIRTQTHGRDPGSDIVNAERPPEMANAFL